MPRRATRLAALLAALLATPALAPPTSPSFFSSPPTTPPTPTGSSMPVIPLRKAAGLASRQGVAASLSHMARAHSLKKALRSMEGLTLDLYPWSSRYPTVQLGEGSDAAAVSAGPTRLHMRAKVGYGTYGTVLGGEFVGSDGVARTIAVKRMLTAQPAEVLSSSLRECGAALVGGLAHGVVPCYGLIVGPNFTIDLVDQVRQHLDRIGDAPFTQKVPIAMGGWSHDGSRGWNVSLLEPWIRGAVDGWNFKNMGAFASKGLFAPKKGTGSAVAHLHTQLSTNDNWRHVPAAMVACVTRLAKFLLIHNVWHRDIKPANMLFTPDFASRPLEAQNCLLIDFGAAASLDFSTKMVTGTRAFLHPEVVDLGVLSPAHRHSVDIFSGATSAMALILGGYGHPLLRCMNDYNGRRRALALLSSERRGSRFRRQEIANRLANLSEEDMRGLAVASRSVCDELGNLVLDSEAIRRREAQKTRSDFVDRAKLYGWMSEAGEVIPGPELGDVARLYSLTAGFYQPRTVDQFLWEYGDILVKLVKRSE